VQSLIQAAHETFGPVAEGAPSTVYPALAFTGALLMTPFVMVVAGRPSGPPTLVTFLPAFWLLVPRAGVLAGVTRYLGDNRIDGVNSLVTAGTTMIGIAFGVSSA